VLAYFASRRDFATGRINLVKELNGKTFEDAAALAEYVFRIYGIELTLWEATALKRA
jgi:hypothetical protein